MEQLWPSTIPEELTLWCLIRDGGLQPNQSRDRARTEREGYHAPGAQAWHGKGGDGAGGIAERRGKPAMLGTLALPVGSTEMWI